jgi:hypothetical protein
MAGFLNLSVVTILVWSLQSSGAVRSTLKFESKTVLSKNLVNNNVSKNGSVANLAADVPAAGDDPVQAALVQQSNQSGMDMQGLLDEKMTSWLHRGRESVASLRSQETEAQQAQQVGGAIGNFILQMILAFIFFQTVASKYPNLMMPNDRSKDIMKESPCFRCNPGPTCLQSWCCYPSMIALVADKAGMLPFLPAAIVGACFPCCLLLWLRSFTDLNVKLGSPERESCGSGCLLSCCCAICSIARDADALDAATGSTIGCFTVTTGVPQVYVAQAMPQGLPVAAAVPVVQASAPPS